MNERIQLLALAAGINVEELTRPYPGGFPREDILVLEDFAQLLIEDFDALIEKYSCANMESDNTVHMLEAMRVELKQRFGVEE
jgi:hypothetical protein